jgi:hypothetical protein
MISTRIKTLMTLSHLLNGCKRSSKQIVKKENVEARRVLMESKLS